MILELMKLQILSDLHIDSYARQSHPLGHIPKTDADVVLVAGDTANSDSGMPWLQEQAARLQVPVITIAGNHEYFNEDVLHFDKKLATWDNYNAQSQQGVRFLQCQHIDIGDIRILGCTLWTDYQYQANEDTIAAAMRFMRDYKQIYAGGELFSPEVSMQIHAKQRQWLKQALITAKTLGKKTVVMSHHSISHYRCLRSMRIYQVTQLLSVICLAGCMKIGRQYYGYMDIHTKHLTTVLVIHESLSIHVRIQMK